MPRRYYILLCVLGCCLVGFAGMWLLDRSRSSSHLLPDGSRIVLRGVSYGNSHRFPVGNLWQRAAGRLLPSFLGFQFPTLEQTDTNSPSLMLWFEHIGVNRNKPLVYGGHPNYTDPPDWQGLFDDSGTDFASYNPAVSAQSSGNFVQGFHFGALPCRSPQLHFRYVCADRGGAWTDTTVFTFDNPAFRPDLPIPTKYPFSVHQGNVTLVLDQFRPKARKKKHIKEMVLAFDVFENKKPAPIWELHEIDVCDPRGGKFHPGTWEWGHPQNHTGMEFDGALSTNSTWTLQLGLRHGWFLTNEILTITNLSLPKHVDSAIELARIPFQGTTVVVQRKKNPGDSTVDIRASLYPDDNHYFLELVEVPRANGKPFNWSSNTFINSRDDTHSAFGFRPGITNIDLKLGVTRKVLMEVTVTPAAR